MNSYTSTLVSNLVKSSSKNKIKTIKDLENSQLKIGFDEIPYIHSFLNVSDLFFPNRTHVDIVYKVNSIAKVHIYVNYLFANNIDVLSKHFIYKDTLKLTSIKCTIL